MWHSEVIQNLLEAHCGRGEKKEQLGPELGNGKIRLTSEFLIKSALLDLDMWGIWERLEVSQVSKTWRSSNEWISGCRWNHIYKNEADQSVRWKQEVTEAKLGSSHLVLFWRRCSASRTLWGRKAYQSPFRQLEGQQTDEHYGIKDSKFRVKPPLGCLPPLPSMLANIQHLPTYFQVHEMIVLWIVPHLSNCNQRLSFLKYF